jgi:hypothetical protein
MPNNWPGQRYGEPAESTYDRPGPRQSGRAQHWRNFSTEAAAADQHQTVSPLRELVSELQRNAPT